MRQGIDYIIHNKISTLDSVMTTTVIFPTITAIIKWAVIRFSSRLLLMSLTADRKPVAVVAIGMRCEARPRAINRQKPR